MAENIRVGTKVKWAWGDGTAEGKVSERFTEKVTRTIKGSDVTRNACTDEPAFLIEQSDGAKVLKSITEIERAE
ncbi:MAG: DUF2945 domain-containing protein [Pseudomonadota bacterium]